MCIRDSMEGAAIPMSEVKDATFASEVLGKGIAVIPKKGEVTAPCDAVVETVFATRHAIGLKADHGVEILIHVDVYKRQPRICWLMASLISSKLYRFSS